MRTQARMLVGRAAIRLRAGLCTRRGKVLAVVVLVALAWSTATFTARHVADSAFITVNEVAQVATVDGGIAIERKGVYSGPIIGDGAARVQAILNSGPVEPGPVGCGQVALKSTPREYQFWFYSHGIALQYVRVSERGCAVSDMTTLGIPALWIHFSPTPAQWDTIDGVLGLAPLQLQN